MNTQKGELIVGIEIDGITHKEFEMRNATIRDAISSINKAHANGEDTNSYLTRRLYKAAEQLVSLGSLPADKVNAELLLSLNESDFDPILNAQDELEKKLKGLKS